MSGQDIVLSAADGGSFGSYPGVDHAFARAGGEHYDRAAADLANQRAAASLPAALA